MTSLTLSGVDVQIDVQGCGPAILFVQGGAATTVNYWLDIPERTAEFATVITVDRPGVGRSPHPGPLSLQEQAAHLAEIIEEVGAGPAIPVGHSLGGPVSVQLALDRPELVSKLLLLDSTPFNDLEQLKAAKVIFAPLAFLEKLPSPLSALPLGLLRRLIVAQTKKEAGRAGVAVDAAYERSIDTVFMHHQSTQMMRLFASFEADGNALTARLREQPVQVGGVLATADRKAGHRAIKAHEEVARLLGLDLEIWERTGHSNHLQRPARTVETIRRLLGP